jgi:protein involved in sex pheromone biosynthesis
MKIIYSSILNIVLVVVCTTLLIGSCSNREQVAHDALTDENRAINKDYETVISTFNRDGMVYGVVLIKHKDSRGIGSHVNVVNFTKDRAEYLYYKAELILL